MGYGVEAYNHVSNNSDNLGNYKGTYVALFYLSRKRNLEVGSLSHVWFDKGYYLYVGSGMNNVFKRIERHKKKDKKKRWHIDYLSSDHYVSFVGAWIVFDKRVEEEVAHYLFYILCCEAV